MKRNWEVGAVGAATPGLIQVSLSPKWLSNFEFAYNFFYSAENNIFKRSLIGIPLLLSVQDYT